jgi:hypothetical protein
MAVDLLVRRLYEVIVVKVVIVVAEVVHRGHRHIVVRRLAHMSI